MALTQTDAQLVADTLLNTLLDTWFTPHPTPSVHVADALASQYAALNISTNGPTLFDRFGSIDTQLTAVQGSLTANQAAVLTAIGSEATGQVDVAALAAALVPALSAADATALLAELKQLLDSQPS